MHGQSRIGTPRNQGGGSRAIPSHKNVEDDLGKADEAIGESPGFQPQVARSWPQNEQEEQGKGAIGGQTGQQESIANRM